MPTRTGTQDTPTEPRSGFLLVRSHADLEGTSAKLLAYLRHLRRTQRTRDCDGLQGIWIDTDGPAEVPGALVLPDAQGRRHAVRVAEATGLNGVWMLCWLDRSAASVSRVDLLVALLECFADANAPLLSGRFVPVFPVDAPHLGVGAELQRLRARYPDLMLAPLSQDGGGSLVQLPAHPAQAQLKSSLNIHR